jgi:hypothetical protein
MNTNGKTVSEEGGVARPEHVSAVTSQLPLVTPILGLIAVEGAALTSGAKPANNSTRWVVDIEDAKGQIMIQLLELRSGRPLNPDLIAISLVPRSASFYDVKPFVDIRGGCITLHHVGPGVCSYRVSIDAMHTATR